MKSGETYTKTVNEKVKKYSIVSFDKDIVKIKSLSTGNILIKDRDEFEQNYKKIT